MGTCAGLLGLLLALPGGKEPARVEPAASIVLRDRQGRVAPQRSGPTRTGGGLIDVAQPSPDVVVVTLTGVAVAVDHPFCSASAAMSFELEQCFDVVAEGPRSRPLKMTVEGRVVGLLRSGGKGAASEEGGCATLSSGDACLATVCLPDHSVAGGESLGVNDRIGPRVVAVAPGAYTLRQTWQVTATHDTALIDKASSAEFAPDPALDPAWIGPKEPFHGIPKKDLGFQIVVRIADDAPPAQ
jgi:hypothetical protein